MKDLRVVLAMAAPAAAVRDNSDQAKGFLLHWFYGLKLWMLAGAVAEHKYIPFKKDIPRAGELRTV